MGIRAQVVLLVVLAAGCSFDQGGYGLGDPGAGADAGVVPPQPTIDATIVAPPEVLPTADAALIKPIGPLPFMSDCARNDQCASQLCVKFGPTQRCTIACDDRTVCPTPSSGCSRSDKGPPGPGFGGPNQGDDDSVCLP